MPYCDGCNACVSVRVLVDEFAPGRSFRRVLDANRDVVVRRCPPRPTAEQYALFRDYIEARHGDGGMADMTVLDFAMMVEDSILDTTVTEYRVRPDGAADGSEVAWPLLAVALCDRLSDGLSMVYSFFDPEAHVRSLGSLMILDHIAFAQRLGVPYLYLGYWISGSRKMAYKARFRPQERLGPDGWVRASNG
jgi:arginine-tRNA-protein transferase